jgi:divalent metal cation (Fe/Co/Zn/Cd) transporter
LASADAVSALGVAGMVVWVSLKLGKKSIDDLLDAVPTDLHKNIGDMAKVPGVCDVRNVRVRRSGPELFVDLTLLVPYQESLQRSHAIASSAEQAIRHEFPNADVVVHVEPSDTESENLLETAKRIAAQHGASAHNLVVHEEGGRWILELHVEMPGALPLAMAHDQAAHIEEEIAHALPSLARVSIHIEPEGGRRQASHASREEIQRIEAVLQEAMASAGRGDAARDLEIRRCESDFSICFTCTLPAQLSVNETHVFTEKVERFLRTRLPDLDRVLIRTEPGS